MALSDAPRYIPPPPNHRRLLVLGLVVAAQVFIAILVQSGLAKMMVDVVRGPMETRLIEEIIEEKEAPPPPPPTFKAPPPVFVAAPDLVISEAPSEASISANAKPQAAAPPPPKDVVVAPRSNPRRPNSGADEIYPAMSKRLGEEGSVILLLTVGVDGKVTAADIKESSGFQRLDEAAAKEAVRSWRFLPGTINGKPAAMQMPLKVTFKISK